MKIQIFKTVCLALSLLSVSLFAQKTENRWNINPDGSISWIIDERVPHYDHMEMSGKKVSTVVRYGVGEDGRFYLNRGMVWPMLRTVPNNTHASLMRRMGWNPAEGIVVNGFSLEKEKVKEIRLNGLMTVKSTYPVKGGGEIELVRELFPAVSSPAFLEKFTIRNTAGKTIMVEIPSQKNELRTEKSQGVKGSYRIVSGITGNAAVFLAPQQDISFAAYTAAYDNEQTDAVFDIDAEKKLREDLINCLRGNLVLETPDSVLNTMFSFAKIRASESIYDTKQGPMHGPGGESYYAAIWANDQAEYINPFFPFLGYDYGNESAMNSFHHFARYMNPEYKPIPSSIIAEGLGFWNGAGDRGDAAMIAYGAARYALASGNKEEARQLWPLIKWCLEFCRLKLNDEGVVASDADELENRFPAGEANLCTSSLYYDALLSAAYLGKELNDPVSAYAEQAKALRKAIDSYFAFNVEGFDTYRYYKGNDILRSWICMPLTVGIYDRKQGTVDALFSPRLWTNDGLLTQAGSKTFWDRSTLYALRGVFAAGETDKAYDYLKYYSENRLLGEHVPYAIEAWPEGSQRHLSAESGLYCRIITEGLFDIRPTGLHSFTVTPHLPAGWDKMALNRIKAFGGTFDIEVVRKGDKMIVSVISAGKKILKKTVSENTPVRVKL